MKANKSWFKLKRYPHIGLPISPNQRNDIEKFIHNKIKISHYAFLPLIRREHRTFKYKLCPDGKFRKKTKIRHISYASHFDSLIYSYYVHIPADTRSAFPVISVQSPVSIQCCWQS